MDTQDKYGLTQKNAILLFVQMIFVVVGTIIAIIAFVGTISQYGNVWMVLSTLITMIAFLAMILFATVGYKKGAAYFNTTIYAMTAGILVRVLIPNSHVAALLLCVVSFGIAMVICMHLRDSKHCGKLIIVLMLLLAIQATISCVAPFDVAAIGSSAAMKSVIVCTTAWAPVILACTVAVTYYTNSKKGVYNDYE